MDTLTLFPCNQSHFAPVVQQEPSSSRIKAVKDVASQHSADLGGDLTTPKEKVLQRYKVTVLDRVKSILSNTVKCAVSWGILGLAFGSAASLVTWNPAPAGIGTAAGAALGATLAIIPAAVLAVVMTPEDKLANRMSAEKTSIQWLEDSSLPFSRSRAERYLREYNEMSFERDRLDVSLVTGGDEMQFPNTFITSLNEKITDLEQLQGKVVANKQKVAKSVHRRLQKLVDLKRAILTIECKNEALSEAKLSLENMQAEMDLLQS